MATSARRIPLASISNATNSPHRPLTHSGTKRPRSVANLSQQENGHPQKRLAGEKLTRERHDPITPQKQSQPSMPEGRVFERSHGESRTTAFERKLVAARDREKAATQRASKAADAASKEDYFKNWQRQYRKIFPTFRFYFDGFTDEAKTPLLRQILVLGACEEGFFSKDATHIVTTRQIPAELAKNGSAGDVPGQYSPTEEQPQTINPSLLERNPRTQNAANTTRNSANQKDILVRAKEMGIKIYDVDKLQRVINSMFARSEKHEHNTRGSIQSTRQQREDLGEVLRNEKLGVASEKELPLASLVPFKGPFIYVHDMDERYRPTMVREYTKPATRSEGEWPQFRSAGMGKCPFVLDPSYEQEQKRVHKRAQQQDQQRQGQPRRGSMVPRTRSHIVVTTAAQEPARRMSPRKPLAAVTNSADTSTTIADIGKNGRESKSLSSNLERQPSFPPMPARAEIEFARPAKLHMPREPAASGMQRSNLTSAIQSQMISSTAPTGIKVGTSKEVHQQLKRQVLERTHTASLSVGSIPSSHRMTDLACALKTARAPAPQRAAKSKAQEKLGGIQEEADPHEDDMAAERAVSGSRKRQVVRKDPKPGYCENCRDKYDDFDEHITSRKHRKFAMTQANWTELDALLFKLQEP